MTWLCVFALQWLFLYFLELLGMSATSSRIPTTCINSPRQNFQDSLGRDVIRSFLDDVDETARSSKKEWREEARSGSHEGMDARGAGRALRQERPCACDDRRAKTKTE